MSGEVEDIGLGEAADDPLADPLDPAGLDPREDARSEAGGPAPSALEQEEVGLGESGPLLSAEESAALFDAIRSGAVEAHAARPASLGSVDEPMRRAQRKLDELAPLAASDLREALLRAGTVAESVEAAHSDQSESALIASRLHLRTPPLRMDSQAKYAAVASGAADIYLINPEMMPKLLPQMMKQKRIPADMLVIDELSVAKNPSSVRFKALSKHLDRFTQRIGLTGTPVPNS
jgi:hypothetical protein